MSRDEIGEISLNAIKERHAELQESVVRTPVVPLDTPVMREALGEGAAFLKLENFQHTGTFKARGALSNARAIPEAKRASGITAASAGNHAIAAAWAARTLGLTARVVMQDTANPFRVVRAKAEGAEVIMRPPGAATFGEAERLAKEEGMTFIHPFDGVNTVLGTAGVGLELLEQIPTLEAVVVSVGGGGLISGVATAVKLMNPNCKVFGVEPAGAAGMSKSLAEGAPATLEKVETIADSLAPPMALSMGYALCASYVDEIVTVSDDEICAGMVLYQQEAKLAVEPAAGAALAALMWPLREQLAGLNCGVIVCGANIDAESYMAQLDRGVRHLSAV